MSRPDARALADVLGDHPLLPAAWRAATAAGRFLKDERPTALVIDTKSSPSDSVTVMDRTAESMIVDMLLGPRPDDGLLGEEGGERPGTSGVRWIVDPLDGTVNYLYGIPLWGVSIAAEVDGVVEVGVVATPMSDEVFIGTRGKGSWCVRDGVAERLAVRSCDSLESALVSTGFGYAAARRRRQAAVLAGLIGSVRDVRRSGCAVIDLCWLARGRMDGLFEVGLNAWDIAAGGLIAREAGAVVTGLSDEDASVLILAAVPGLHAALRAALADLRADEV